MSSHWLFYCKLSSTDFLLCLINLTIESNLAHAKNLSFRDINHSYSFTLYHKIKTASEQKYQDWNVCHQSSDKVVPNFSPSHKKLTVD